MPHDASVININNNTIKNIKKIQYTSQEKIEQYKEECNELIQDHRYGKYYFLRNEKVETIQ